MTQSEAPPLSSEEQAQVDRFDRAPSATNEPLPDMPEESVVTDGYPDLIENPTPEERQKVISEAYNQAGKALRERYAEEFADLRSHFARLKGIDWTPPETPEQKAEKTVRELLEEHPSLKTKLGIE